MPVLVLRFLDERYEPTKGYISERMVNIGTGPALDVRIEFNGEFVGGNLTHFQEGGAYCRVAY